VPLYEFTCDSCGNHIEKLVKYKHKKSRCPACGESMSRDISVSNFRLPGHFTSKDNYGLKDMKDKGDK
jgi:putative FmdB family regulatory protein